MIQKGSLMKVASGIPGFDAVANGGLPKGRTTLVSGARGSGKTVMALHFLCAGVRHHDDHGVLVTFEESSVDLIQNVKSFGWDIVAMLKEGKLAIVDATSNPEEQSVHTGPYTLTALVARVEHSIKSVGAKRVVLDSVDSLFGAFADADVVGRELHRLAVRLRKLGVTTFVTMRRAKDGGGRPDIAADNVVVLRNRLHRERRRRTVEVLQVRGAAHRTGEHAFDIDPEHGFVIVERPVPSA
jgi:circadian clock protein KaiC